MTKEEMQNFIIKTMRALYGLDTPSCFHDDGEGGIALEYRWGGKAAIVYVTSGEIRMNCTPETARNLVGAYTREAAVRIFGHRYDVRMRQTLDADHISAHYHGA